MPFWGWDLVRGSAVGSSVGMVGVVDKSAFTQKGAHSAGVARQHNGRLGKEGYCQVGVFLIGGPGRVGPARPSAVPARVHDSFATPGPSGRLSWPPVHDVNERLGGFLDTFAISKGEKKLNDFLGQVV